jgi:peptidoglycan hydrolase-like protein with peptidoglycan-binding domain
MHLSLRTRHAKGCIRGVRTRGHLAPHIAALRWGWAGATSKKAAVGTLGALEFGMSILKEGSSGAEVKALQGSLKKLGFSLETDGSFGPKTHNAIITLQTIFGYDQDGLVGPATLKLLDQQIGYNWSLTEARKAYTKPNS